MHFFHKISENFFVSIDALRKNCLGKLTENSFSFCYNKYENAFLNKIQPEMKRKEILYESI